MGYTDLKIDLATYWRRKYPDRYASKIQRLKSGSSTHSQPCDPSSSKSTSSVSEAAHEADSSTIMALELYQAATKDDVDGLIAALEHISAEKGLGFSEILEQVSPLGNTLLHVAASNGNQEIVRLLVLSSLPLQFKPLLLKQNLSGDTALHLAARAGHDSVIDALLTIREESDWKLFVHRDESRATFKELADYKILLRIKNRKGNTALHEYIINQHEFGSTHLISQDPETCYLANNEGKSPLYIAAQAGQSENVKKMLDLAKDVDNKELTTKGRSPLVAAIVTKNKGLMNMILSRKPTLISILDDEGRTVLHYAASIGCIDIIEYILTTNNELALTRDKKGFFPVHVAAAQGQVLVVKMLLDHCPHPGEMVTYGGQNILHIAAARGRDNVVRFILRTPTLQCLINEEDYNGNTPLHLATLNWHPKVVSTLTWDSRVNLAVVDDEGLTALDAAEYYMEGSFTYDKRLTWTALKSANAPRASKNGALKLNPLPPDSSVSQQSIVNNYKDRVNTLLVVATLVATITFAAGFTMPGGYGNNGMATMLQEKAFSAFIFSDTIAMYSSILVVISLIWAQLGELKLVLIGLRLAVPFLGVSLAMMSLAFVAGVYLVVSQLNWLAYTASILGLAFLVACLALFIPLVLPISSGNLFFRYLTYYPFHILLKLTVKTEDNSHEYM